MNKKIIIIGGVAGGASCAARARRLCESAQILIIERSGYVSFANCGLPYHIGSEITDRKKLLVHTPKSLKDRFNIDVRIQTEATKVDLQSKEVELRELDSGKVYREKYDELVFSTGAAALKPALPGIDHPAVHTLRNMEDMDAILDWINTSKPRSAVIVGGGYIGLEMVEQLKHRIETITVIESNPQLLKPLDPEMAIAIEQELKKNNVSVFTAEALQAIEGEQPTRVITTKGRQIEAELIILAIGVRPESIIAQEAGLEIGKSGGIKVNEYLQTSGTNIWALGDAIEVKHFVTSEMAPIPLAGPANRQGRLVADNIFLSKRKYQGSLGTAIARVFSLTAACTGANEKTLKRLGIEYTAHYLYPNNHAGYYPGASTLQIKILVSPESRKLLGAQVVGEEGADKRIDIFATAILGGLSVDDISELELAYAPPYGSAKDPVNLAGMLAQNALNGLVDVITPSELQHLLKSEKQPDIFLLDVRDATEYANGSIDKAVNIPLNNLRENLGTLPQDREIIVFCASAQRSYNASRILGQNGFKVRNLSGAMRAWKQHIAASHLR